MVEQLPENELFYCTHISSSDSDRADIAKFTVRHKTGMGLVYYLQNQAIDDEDAGLMRSYLVRSKITNELAGYYSIKAGLVSTNEHRLFTRSFDTIPGIELANFAANASFTEKFDIKGMGSVIFGDFVLPIISQASLKIGVNIIYLFALPYDSLIKTYLGYGFKRLNKRQEARLHHRLKPNYDKSCIFMFRRLDE